MANVQQSKQTKPIRMKLFGFNKSTILGLKNTVK